jgi:hypothetical protein
MPHNSEDSLIRACGEGSRYLRAMSASAGRVPNAAETCEAITNAGTQIIQRN